MKIKLVLLNTIIVFFLIGCIPIVIKSIEQVVYFDNGNIKSRLEPSATSPTSFTYFEYYESGEIYFKAPIIDAKWEGIVEYYYANGGIKERIEYSRDKPNGKRITFYENGNIFKVIRQKDGYTIGDYSVFHANGWLEEEGTILQPKINPGDIQKIVYILYYENGDTLYTAQKWDDEVTGEARRYWPEGSLQSIYNYQNSAATGEYSLYHQDGWLSESGNITYTSSGLERLNYKLFNKMGVIIGEGLTLDGNKDGEIREYWPNGKVSSINYYEYGMKKRNFKEFNNKGQLIREGVCIDTECQEKFLAKIYNHDGTIKSTCEVHDGMYQGWLDIFEGGNLVASVLYVDDMQEGAYKEYYPNGKIKVKGRRVNDKLEGKLIRYYENGRIKMKATFKNNKMNGYRQSYSKYGEKLQTVYYENGIMQP